MVNVDNFEWVKYKNSNVELKCYPLFNSLINQHSDGYINRVK